MSSLLDNIRNWLLGQEEADALADEFQTLSEVSLRQTRKLLFLLEASKSAIGASLDLGEVLQKLIDSVALASNADYSLIAVVDETDPDLMLVIAGYDPLRRQVWRDSGASFNIQDYPAIHHAVRRRKQVLLRGTESSEPLGSLHTLLGVSKIGPLLIEPLVLQKRVLGVMLLSNAHSQRLFTAGERDVVQALASQAVSAVENARLYKELDLHSQELAQLLNIREREATERQAILESIADGVIVANAEGLVRMVNPAAEQIFGRRFNQLKGQPIRQLLGGVSLDAEPDKSDDQPGGLQATRQLAGKTVWVSMAPVRGPDDNLMGYVGVLRDITQEVAAERAKSNFITNVSHELRTPLTVIKGYVSLLADGVAGELSDTQRNFLDTVQSNTEKMAKLVQDLITVSELSTAVELQIAQSDLRTLLEETLEYIRPQAEERGLALELVVLAADGPLEIEADPSRVYQVMEHLLHNACRFTQEGGRITVRAQARNYDDHRQWLISVTDTGAGIPLEEQERIFDPFYQVGGDVQEIDGAGVGLTIARGLVEAHGGRLWVESRPGKGSTFSFILPVSQSLRAPEASEKKAPD